MMRSGSGRSGRFNFVDYVPDLQTVPDAATSPPSAASARTAKDAAPANRAVNRNTFIVGLLAASVVENSLATHACQGKGRRAIIT